jgi:hypothetical protein
MQSSALSESVLSHKMAWHPKELFFPFPSLFFVTFHNSFAKIYGKYARKCLKIVAFLANLRYTCP